MKRILYAASLLLSTLSTGQAQTVPLYINSFPLLAPTQIPYVPVPVIDARAWANQASFSIYNNTTPFEAFNNVLFTNELSREMFFDPGLRSRNRNVGSNGWSWMDSWVNRGNLVTDHTTFSGLLAGNVLVFDSRASILQVAATNITSKGALLSGTHGLIRLEGKRIDVSRSSLRTGSSLSSNNLVFGSLLQVGVSNFVNDVGIRDLYWGVGRGDAVAAARSGTMNVTSNAFQPNFSEGSPSSTFHEVIQPSGFGGTVFTNLTSVPSGFFFTGNSVFINTNTVQYRAEVYEVNVSPTNRIVQVVFYPSNLTDPEFTTDVRFYPTGGPRGARAAVGFHAREFDITTRNTTTNSVYLVDGLMATTNSFLARNAAGGTRRPNTLAVTRVAPSEYRFGFRGVPISSNTLYGNFSLTDVTNRYAAYAAQVDLLSSSSSGSIPYDVTNAPGRIELIGDELNLDQTRIRAESSVIIKTQNLISNNFAQVDAPLLNFDARSVQPVFNIVNLAPQSVRRFGGIVRAWSASWDNFETSQVGTNIGTNSVTFHVLIVESQLRSTVPVSVNEFAARATNIVLGDQLNIAKSFLVEANSLHVVGGITLPFGSNLTASNLVNIRNFTNDGIITIPGGAVYGTDRALSYSNWVNHGTNVAAAIGIRTRNFENSGVIVANGGSVSVDAVSASMIGNPLVVSNFAFSFISYDFFSGVLVTNTYTSTATLQAAPLVSATSDVNIRARDLLVSNSVINAGRLILNVTNRLADSGVAATNNWNVTAGFQTTRRPTTSDLLGTHVRSSAPIYGLVEHAWSGADMGAVAVGYTNNLALGKLTFDGGSNSLFQFFPVGTSNALYVDYIELLNDATNYNSAFSISPNFTIYFANANVPVTKLHGAAGGRFQWVSSFAGPLSSTNITYHTPPNAGSNFVFNIALVTDNDLDSDGDGLVNSQDDEPIYVPGSAMLSVAMASGPSPCVILTWNALAYSSNYLEFKASTTATQWNTLTNFHMGPYTWPVMVDDPISTNGEMRVYRVRVDIGPYY